MENSGPKESQQSSTATAGNESKVESVAAGNESKAESVAAEHEPGSEAETYANEKRLEELRQSYLEVAATLGITSIFNETKDHYAARWRVVPPPWSVAEEGKLELTDDPLQAVKINNEHRRADVADGKGSGLWTADQVAHTTSRVYRFMAPTFAPPRWGTVRAVDQETYSRTFRQEFPEVGKILPMPNVAVAGGAAAWPLGNPAKKASDVDFFIYGLPSDDSVESRKIRWSCVGALADRIREQFYQCVEMLSAGVITIKAWRQDSGLEVRRPSIVKFQIILRAYSSLSSILHGFVVPSCCVAYDGHITCMTYLAAYAHVFHANVVEPAYSSTTYESRLLKYFDRGYALVLPYLDAAMLVAGEELALPNLSLAPTIVRGRFATSSVLLRAAQPESDYSFAERRHLYYSRWDRQYSKNIYGQSHINLKMTVTDKPVIMLGAKTKKPRRHYHRQIDFRDSGKTGLPLATFWQEPTRAKIFPREQLQAALKIVMRAVVSKAGKINVTALRTIFGLSEEQITRLTQQVSEIWEEARKTNLRIDVTPSLKPFCEKILAKYDSQPDRIDWWVLTDPMRQHTASRNPRCEGPAQWYGSAYTAPINSPSSDETLDAIVGLYETRMLARECGAVYDGACSICHDEIRSGDANSVSMSCGHVFHWSAASDCGGVCAWVICGNRSCPLCRAVFIDDDSASDTEFSRGNRFVPPIHIDLCL